jgi:hypothetical protein
VARHGEPPIDRSVHTGFIRFVDRPCFWAVTSQALAGEVFWNPRCLSAELDTTVSGTPAPGIGPTTVVTPGTHSWR